MFFEFYLLLLNFKMQNLSLVVLRYMKTKIFKAITNALAVIVPFLMVTAIFFAVHDIICTFDKTEAYNIAISLVVILLCVVGVAALCLFGASKKESKR